MKRVIFFLSLTANVAFVSYWLSRSPDSLIQIETKQLSENHRPESISLSTTQIFPDADKSQSSLSLSAKQDLLASLKEQYVDSIPLPEDRYWEEEPKHSQISYQIQRLDAYDQIREALKIQFGESVSTDPSFVSVFKPLSSSAPYLSSDEQIALQRFHTDQALLALALGGRKVSSNQTNQGSEIEPIRDLTKSPQNETDIQTAAQLIGMQEKLSKSLSAQSQREYDLRHSYLAKILRQSDFAFKESQFRQAYDIVQEASSSRAEQGALSNNTDKLRALIDLVGISAGAEIWAQLDTSFAQLAARASGQGLDEEQAALAYEIFQDARRSFIEAQQIREVDPSVGKELLVAAVEERRYRLISLFGEDVALALTQRPTQ